MCYVLFLHISYWPGIIIDYEMYCHQLLCNFSDENKSSYSGYISIKVCIFQFRTKGKGLVNQVLDMLLPDKLFKGRQSEKLCGDRVLESSKMFRYLLLAISFYILTHWLQRVSYRYTLNLPGAQ